MSRKRKQSSLDKFLNDLDAKYNVPKRARKAVKGKQKAVSDAFNLEKKAKQATKKATRNVQKSAKKTVRKTKTKVKRTTKKHAKRVARNVGNSARARYNRARVKPQATLQAMKAEGWTAQKIHERTQIPKSSITAIMNGKQTGEKHLDVLRAVRAAGDHKGPPPERITPFARRARPEKDPNDARIRRHKTKTVIEIHANTTREQRAEALKNASKYGKPVSIKYVDPPAPKTPKARTPKVEPPPVADVDVVGVVEEEDDDAAEWAAIDAATAGDAPGRGQTGGYTVAEPDDVHDSQADGDSSRGTVVTKVSLT